MTDEECSDDSSYTGSVGDAGSQAVVLDIAELVTTIRRLDGPQALVTRK